MTLNARLMGIVGSRPLFVRARDAARGAIPVTITLVSLATIATGTAWAQSAGAFTPTGRMSVARGHHTATLLPDGKVLIAGGRIHRVQDYRGTVTATAELYDPLTGTFSPTGSMTTPRAWHTATLLPTGKVLIVGADSAAGDERSAELYDPATGTFTRTGDTVRAQSGASATLLKNGKVLIAGGVTPRLGNNIVVSTPELYDPATGTFAETGGFVGPGDGSFIVGGPNSPSVSLLRDGRVLFAAEPFSEIYDPATGTFSDTGMMETTCGPFYGRPNYIGGRTATLLTSGEVLLAGGGHEDCGRLAEAERYNPVSGTFTLIQPMTRRRTLHTATALRDGTVLIAGGESESGFHLITEATAEIYDPVSATFSVVGAMQGGREGHTATLLNDGRVLLAGGVFYQDVGIFLGSLDTADLYTLATLAPPVPVFPIEGVITEDVRPRLQVHNIPRPRPGGIVRYRFDWSDRSDFGASPRSGGADAVPEGEGTDTAYAIPGDLEFDTGYYWRARAAIAQPDGTTVTSAYSEVRSFRTPRRGSAQPQSAVTFNPSAIPVTATAQHHAGAQGESGEVPAPLRLAAAASGSGVVLTWMAPPNTTPIRYAIAGGDAPHLSNLPVIVTPDASTDYTISALPSGTYYFRVWAIVAGALSSPSNEAAVVVVGSASASIPPTGVRAQATGGFATATWTPSPLAGTLYQVEIGDAPGLANVAILTTVEPSVTYRLSSAGSYVTVRAVRGMTVSAPSNQVFVAAPRTPCSDPPSRPLLLPVSTSNGRATISWLPGSEPLGSTYRVDGSGPSGPLTMTTDGTGTSLTAPFGRGVYTIRVTAISACGESMPSNAMTFSGPAEERPR